MVAQKLRFSLTAYDPNPSDVLLDFVDNNCVVESSSGSSVSVEDYKTTEEGNPSEVYLKVTPDPIAFVMKFVDGKMMIEFKGSWDSFQVTQQESQTRVTRVEVTPEPVLAPEPDPEPAPVPVEIDLIPAFSTFCFKVHFVEDDVDAHDIRLMWDMNELSVPDGAGYKIVYQTDTENGKEFVLAFPHPITGEIFCIRGLIKDGKMTILNTDKFDMEHIQLYLAFYIKDPELIQKILAEMEANPGFEIMILYKYGAFGEAIDLSSFNSYVSHEDKDKKAIKSKNKEDDDHVRKARESQKKAEEEGKKGSEAPNDDKDWSCGRVKWELPKEEKKFRDVGKLKIPEFGPKEAESNLQDVGKLQWSGFQQEEPKVPKKEKPKVGKLNIGAFGAPADKPPSPPKRTWKKRNSVVAGVGTVAPDIASLTNGAK